MNKKIIKNICFLISAIIILSFIAVSIYDSVSMWNSEPTKTLNYESFLQFYFIREKGLLIIGLCLASALSAVAFSIRIKN